MRDENQVITEERPSRKTSRRGMLRLAVPAAAAGTAALAAGELLRPGSAFARPANDGNNMVIGQVNHSTSTTWLINDVSGTDVTMILVDDYTGSQTGAPRGYTSGLTSRSVGGTGVLGIYNSPETGGGVAVLAKFQTGVYGLANYPSTGGIGVGVVAHSINATAPLLIVPEGNSGGSAAGAALPGAVWADGSGALWNARNSSSPTTIGTWYPLSSVNFLAHPIRIFDSRSGSTAPLPAVKGKVPANTVETMQVTGTTVSGLSVPAGAKAVIANATAVSPVGPGFLAFWPHGAAFPGVSNINYVGGQIIANFCIVGLDANGQMNYEAGGGSATDMLFDVAGYII